MASDRVTMRTNLQYALGNRTDLGVSRLNTWLDEGLLDMSSKIRIRNNETIVTATLSTSANSLAIPSTILVPLQLRNDTDDILMHYMEYTEYRTLRIQTRRPTRWTTLGTTFYFDATPDAADTISISGITRPAWGSGDSGAHGLDDEYEYGIHLLAQAHAWRDLGYDEKALLLDNPAQPGTGAFWVWARANRFPPLMQGMSPRQSAVLMDLSRYDGLGS